MLRRLLTGSSTLMSWPHIYNLMWPRPPFFPLEGKTYHRTFMAPDMWNVCIVYNKYTGAVHQHVYSEMSDVWYWTYPVMPWEEKAFVPIVFHHAGHKAFHWAIDQCLSHIFSTRRSAIQTLAA